MVDTIKFSEFLDGGDLAPEQKTAGLLGGANVLFSNAFPLLPLGTTDERPEPAPDMYWRLRFNTTIESYEYYSPTLDVWIQLDDSADVFNGPFVIYKADADFPDAFNLGLLTEGLLKQTVSLGIATPAIAINGTDYYGPGFSGFYQSPAGIKDTNGNIVATFVPDLLAVNYLTLSNRATSLGPVLGVEGADTDIQLNLVPKGEGAVALLSQAANNAFIILNGTAYQHETIFHFENTNQTNIVSFQDASGTLAFLSDIPTVTPSALTKTDDTNVTLTLGGSPSVALLAATSLTLGWTGTLSPAKGGSGVDNGSNTLTLAGTLATVGAFASAFTMTGATNVTFPTSGTLATTSQLVTPAALTKTDDTNVTLTLGGSPSTALVNAASLTLGWTGQLAESRGGTGISAFGTGVATALGQNVTGSGGMALATSPTFVTPTLGVASATSLSFSATSGIIGTTTNNDAPTGSVGKLYTASASAAAVPITSATDTDVVMITLDAGDYDVWGNIAFAGNAATLAVTNIGWISLSSASLPGANDYASQFYSAAGVAVYATESVGFTVPGFRVSLAAPATLYLSARSVFSVSTTTAGGRLFARVRR